MNEGLIPRRYAKALYKVDVDRNSADRSYVLMTTLADSFDANPELAATVSNPFVSTEDKFKLIAIAAGASDRDTTFADFLKLLVNNGRIDLTQQIAKAYIGIYRTANNIRSVEVIAPAPLDDAVIGRIKNLVKKHSGGASLEFSTRIDPDLLGGFVINIDNERLDASLSNRLNEMKLSLLN